MNLVRPEGAAISTVPGGSGHPHPTSRRPVLTEGTAVPDGPVPPLVPLHSDASLIESKLQKYGKVSDRESLDSLRPGRGGAMKARPDGTIADGRRRLKILRDRGIDMDALEPEIICKEPVPGVPED